MLLEKRLPDGSLLEYADLGDPRGVPVVHQPGTPGTATVGVLLDQPARRHGVRLLVVSRPGYGASTLTPPGLASVARQLAALADVLDLPTFGVWGSSGGGPYALAQAAVTPDRVTRAAVSAGPASDDADAEEAAAQASIEAEELAGLAALGQEALWEALGADSPPAERYFEEHPEDRPAFLADLIRGVQQPDGYVRDNVSWAVRWDLSLAAVTAPVDLVYGSADQMVTLDNGQRLAAAIPHARLHVLPGAGHGHATFGAADLVLRLFGGGESGL